MKAARLGALALLVASAALGLRWAAASPKTALLPPGPWIGFDEPFLLGTHNVEDRFIRFRRTFTLEGPGSIGSLELTAMKVCQALIDGREVLPPGERGGDWKKPRAVGPVPALAAGSHELLVNVLNADGPPLLRVAGDRPELWTGPGWQASADGGRTWSYARRAEQFGPAPLSRLFPSAREAFLATLPWLLPLFALVSWLAWRLPARPGVLRWALLAVWACWALNNILRLPLGIGFDTAGHLDYIRAVAALRLPLANEGWQMFQPPLYYFVCAPLEWFGRLLDAGSAERLLRLVGWLCGAGLIELSYRAGKKVYPSDAGAQAFCVLFAGALPMSLYLCQYVGNEPLAALLSAGAFVYGVKVLGGQALALRQAATLGGLVGLAVLAKVTALLLVPIFGAYFWMRSKEPPAKRLRLLGWGVGAGVLVCGWYFARNQLVLGRPFFGGWDPAREIAWWQDPGYRTLGSFVSFGESLVHPVYAALAGFWDALYSSFWLDGTLSSMITYQGRPPWEYGCLAAGALLALPVMALLLVGAARAVLAPAKRPEVALAAASVGVYLAALLALYAMVPIYSTVKATYTLGLVPAYALLGAEGLSLLKGRTRAAVWGLLACWAAASLRAYLILLS